MSTRISCVSCCLTRQRDVLFNSISVTFLFPGIFSFLCMCFLLFQCRPVLVLVLPLLLMTTMEMFVKEFALKSLAKQSLEEDCHDHLPSIHPSICSVGKVVFKPIQHRIQFFPSSLLLHLLILPQLPASSRVVAKVNNPPSGR